MYTALQFTSKIHVTYDDAAEKSWGDPTFCSKSILLFLWYVYVKIVFYSVYTVATTDNTTVSWIQIFILNNSEVIMSNYDSVQSSTSPCVYSLKWLPPSQLSQLGRYQDCSNIVHCSILVHLHFLTYILQLIVCAYNTDPTWFSLEVHKLPLSYHWIELHL
jgi:hypothetical protein